MVSPPQMTYENLKRLTDHRLVVDLSDKKTVNDYKVFVDGQEINAEDMRIVTNYIRVNRLN